MEVKLIYNEGTGKFEASYPFTDAKNPLVSEKGAQTLTNKTLTSPAITTPTLTGLETLTDTNGTVRLYTNPTAKAIVDGSATSLFSVLCPSGGMIGGIGFFLVRATNDTDHQAISGTFTYSAVNKAGTSTATITYTTAPEAKAVSSGTLTLAFTAVDSGSGVITYKLQPTGSLTETAPYTIEYTLLPHRGAVTII